MGMEGLGSRYLYVETPVLNFLKIMAESEMSPIKELVSFIILIQYIK
jgi:hypothetical protein